MLQDLTENEISVQLESKSGQPPRLHVFRSAGQVSGAAITADSVKIICSGDTIHAHVIDLLAVYYVFQMSYPKIFSQILGVLQTFVIKTQPYDGQKSSKYKPVVAKLRNCID